jgi:hypothetical protein
MYDGTVDPTTEPVSSLRDLETKVALALNHGVKELEATKEVMSQLLRGEYSDSNNSIIYKNVFLFEVGKKEEAKAKLVENMNRRVHGASRLKGRG